MKYVSKVFFRDEHSYADRIFCKGNTFAVADGMGKKGTGKMAADIAINTLAEFYPIEDADELRQIFNEINRRVIAEISKFGDDFLCGTTLSVLILKEDKYMVGHVGDSRIYLLRDGEIEMLTEDQVRYKGRKKYVSALGTSWNLDILIREGEVKREDIFLLVSDGMVDTLSDGEILTLVGGGDIESGAELLIKRYVQTLPKEDLSFIIVKV